MRKDVINKAGVAALVLLAPGGFLLGFALLARRYRGGAGGSTVTGSSAAPDGD